MQEPEADGGALALLSKTTRPVGRISETLALPDEQQRTRPVVSQLRVVEQAPGLIHSSVESASASKSGSDTPDEADPDFRSWGNSN
jgi:hypothetical protein